MATASTIESFFSLINSTARIPARRAQVANGFISLRDGQTMRLPAGSHVSIISGRVWLTHYGDSRDHFPRGGNSFDTDGLRDSVIEALSDSTLIIQ